MDNLETTLITNALRVEATKQGALGAEISELANRDGIFVSSDGVAYGADVAIRELRQTKPHLFATPQASKTQPEQSQYQRSTDASTDIHTAGREMIEANLKTYHDKYGGSSTKDLQYLDSVFGPKTTTEADNAKDVTDNQKVRDWQSKWNR